MFEIGTRERTWPQCAAIGHTLPQEGLMRPDAIITN
jgi:hypothetical protein